jgi:hypothetical protein
MWLEMKVKDLALEPLSNMPMIILRDEEDKRSLPIWVGLFEANAIALELEKISPPRPMTHDLIKKILESLDARVQKIVVNDVRDNTFYADGESVLGVGETADEVEKLGSTFTDALQEVPIPLAAEGLLGDVDQPRCFAVDRRIDVAEVPLVRGDLPARVEIDLVGHEPQLVLGEIEVDRGQDHAVKRQVPGGEPRIFPLVGHREDVGAVEVEPFPVARIEDARRLRSPSPRGLNRGAANPHETRASSRLEGGPHSPSGRGGTPGLRA